MVCTDEDNNARTNTRMTGTGVPVHWLDGGWEHRPTLVASSNAEFYGSEWVNTDFGAYVTGDSAHFEDHAMVLTGCDSRGVAHPEFPVGADSPMDMVAVGTPNGRSLKTREEAADSNFAPLGAVDVDSGYAYHKYYVDIDGEKQKRPLPLYAISPIFTVYDDGSSRTIWSSTMTVEKSILVTTDRVGFAESPVHGSLSSTQFTYDGTNYSIAQLRTEKTTVSGSVTSDFLSFQPSPMLPTTAESELALELDGVRFPLADATRHTNFYSWSDHGLTWADGDSVEVRLIEPGTQESAQVRVVCTVQNGCRKPRAEVVMISFHSPLVPAGLGIADQFRLMFVSSTKRNAESTDIADYNKFVQDLAATGHADIQAHSSGFRAVACTGDVDAQDNTRTTGTGIRIYWLGGDKAADNYKDFYDGSWDESVNVRDESGTAITVPETQDYDTWTGCNDNGRELFISSNSGALGNTNVGHGRLSKHEEESPLQTGGDRKANLKRLYGLSYIFQVR